MTNENQGRLEDYLERGRRLVRGDRLEDWETFVKKNASHFYSAGIIEASLGVMEDLSEGKTPQEAEQKFYEMNITGCMAGYAAAAAWYFHDRGDEFARYWNGHFMDEEEAKKAKGIVNPAFLTIYKEE